jgi:hypothetical protein
MKLTDLPAEVKQNIISFLVPQVSHNIIHICPCLEKPRPYGETACSCVPTATQEVNKESSSLTSTLACLKVSDTKPTSIQTFFPSTLLVNHDFHEATVAVMPKVAETMTRFNLHVCSVACLEQFLQVTHSKYIRRLYTVILKHSEHQHIDPELPPAKHPRLRSIIHTLSAYEIARIFLDLKSEFTRVLSYRFQLADPKSTTNMDYWLKVRLSDLDCVVTSLISFSNT